MRTDRGRRFVVLAVTRIAVVAVVVVVVSLLGLADAFAAGDANEVGCPVETEASPGFKATMPDCRAYEIVSEANTGDTSNVNGSFGFPEGEHVYYKSFLPTPSAGARNGIPEEFLATRTPSGWQDTTISAPEGESVANLNLGTQVNAEGVGFSSDFLTAFVRSPFSNPLEDPRLNETTGTGAYSISLASGEATLLSLPDSGKLTQTMIESPSAYLGLAENNGWGEFLADVSSDGSRVFFVTTAKLATAPGTPADTHEASNEIYERAGGHTYLVGVLPNGEVPNCGAEVGQGVGSTPEGQTYWSYGAVAPGGDNVVFSSPGPNPISAVNPCNESGLFLRDVVRGTTVKLPGTLFGGRAGTGPGEEEVIFTLNPRRPRTIYKYHVTTEQTEEIAPGALGLLAWSRDGSRVYYLGPEEGIYVYEAGQANLIPGTEAGSYLAGASRSSGLIATFEHTENPIATMHDMPVASAGSSDGSHLLFIDSAQLTGYRNEGHQEAYIYDAESHMVKCISCNLSGESPAEQSPLPVKETEKDAQLIDAFSTDLGEGLYQTPSPPFISADGSRAVFETNEDLVPQDTNGTMDVYEWALAGTNGCTTESTAYSSVIEGCVYLLSSGLGIEGTSLEEFNEIYSGTHLVGASEELQDVYMQTAEVLLPGLDNASHLYDVRADGGFPYSPPAGPGCEPGQCRPRSEQVVFGEPASVFGGGPGNVKSPTGHSRAGSGSKHRLERALRACKKKSHGQKRRRCERRARARFATSRTAVVSTRTSRGSK